MDIIGPARQGCCRAAEDETNKLKHATGKVTRDDIIRLVLCLRPNNNIDNVSVRTPVGRLEFKEDRSSQDSPALFLILLVPDETSLLDYPDPSLPLIDTFLITPKQSPRRWKCYARTPEIYKQGNALPWTSIESHPLKRA